jgi:hypothetical protein
MFCNNILKSKLHVISGFLIVVALFFTGALLAHAQLSFYANDVADTDPSRKAVFADFDNDGDPDVYVANRSNIQNRLWINDGAANFTPAHIPGDNGISYGAAAGDVNGDGWLDIYVANDNNAQNRLWINNANGVGVTPTFTSADIVGDTSYSWGAIMEDFDLDGDLDIYVANNGNGRANRLWINDGLGNFTDGSIPGDNIGNCRTPVAGDIDNDGDMDIYMPKYGQANDLWINDGTANFTLVNIPGDLRNSREAVMQDLDADGDLDIYVVNYDYQQNQLWLNDGPATYTFTNANIVGDNKHSHGGHYGDLDNDGDIDLYVANTNQQNQIWLNDGLANFTEFLIPGDVFASVSATIGDLDADGELDIFVANADQQNKLWINALDVILEQSASQDDPTEDDRAFFDITFSHEIDAATFSDSDISITGLSGRVASGPVQISPMNGKRFRVGIKDMTDADTITVQVLAGVVNSALTLGKVNDASTSVDNQVTYNEPSSGGGSTSIVFSCKDETALNYDAFGQHRQSLCQYDFQELSFLDKLENGVISKNIKSINENLTCPYFNAYTRKGDTGYEVAKLQDFLNQYIDAGIVVDGDFGQTTHLAVKAFQEKHRSDILDPWNLKESTGLFYKTTEGVANEIIGCSIQPRFLERVNVTKKFDNESLFKTFTGELLSVFDSE